MPSFPTSIAILGRVALGCALSLALGRCQSAPAPAEPVPGIAAGAEGLLEVRVVDLDSRAGLAGARVTRLRAGAAPEERATDEGGWARFERTDAGAFALDVTAAGHVAARWTGVVGGAVTLPLRPSPTRAPFEIEVAGLADGERAAVTATTRPLLLQPSSVRVPGTSASALADCAEVAPGRCRARLELDEAPSGRLVLVAVTDAAGLARRLVRFDGVQTDAVLELAAGEPIALEALPVTLPPLPVGLGAVVGVPGMSFGSAVGVLGFPAEGASATLALPDLEGLVATRWALFVATAESGGTPDPSRRSVLVDRRAEAEIGPWTAWLAPPGLVVDAAGATLTPAPGASLHAIDWLDAAGLVLRTDLVLDAAASLEAPAGAASARVRALDTTASPSALVLDAAERATERFSEVDATL